MAENQNHNVDMEFFTAAGMAAAGGFAVSVGEKAYRYMKSREPLVVQILDSTTVDDRVRLAVQFANQTLHGIYLESILITAVSDEQSVEFFQWGVTDSPGMGGHSYGWVLFDWQPKKIAPGSDVELVMEFPKPDGRKVYSSEMKIIFSRLDETKPDAKTVGFRIR